MKDGIHNIEQWLSSLNKTLNSMLTALHPSSWKRAKKKDMADLISNEQQVMPNHSFTFYFENLTTHC